MSIIDTLITDRTRDDAQRWAELAAKGWMGMSAVEQAEWSAGMKGAYNATDLNRVTAAMDYINEQLEGYGYVTGYQRILVHPGSLPEGYTELEYIQSSGTQYIDTGFAPDQDTRVVMDVEPLNAEITSAYFGARSESRQDSFILWQMSETQYRSDYGAHSTSKNMSTLGRKTMDKNKNICTIDGSSLVTTAQTFTCGYNMLLLCQNTNGTADTRKMTARLYSCRIYDNGTLARDFIPCENHTGAVGLYNTVNGAFYPNAGTDAFAAGPAVTPETLAPYTWYESDIPTAAQMEAYLANVEALRSVLDVLSTTPETPESMEALTWKKANDIEQILVDVQTVVTAMTRIFLRSGMAWAVSGGPGFYFVNGVD